MRPHELAGRRIAELRRRANDMTGEEFGEAMGALGFPMSRQTVWKIEKGGRALSLDELFAAAYVLGTSPLGLLDPGTDDAVDVGEGVSLDAARFGEWWVHGYHPRDDISGDEVDQSLPSPLKPHYESISFLYNDRRQLQHLTKLLAEGIGRLPEDQRQAIGSSVSELADSQDEESTDA